MQIAIAVFGGFTALDAIGPYQVFTQMPDAEVVLCAAERASSPTPLPPGPSSPEPAERGRLGRLTNPRTGRRS